mmetsp:Transcript_28156/g.56826  ORF Transcript_28156/g.56826 Transcript_28156/m.56826 type:complete len:91 (-) Transcript_28156:1103-1375(-)
MQHFLVVASFSAVNRVSCVCQIVCPSTLYLRAVASHLWKKLFDLTQKSSWAQDEITILKAHRGVNEIGFCINLDSNLFETGADDEVKMKR